MRRVFVVIISISLLLSACGTLEIYVETTPVGNSVLPADSVAATAIPMLSLNSTSEEIQQAMLESASKWKSIWMDGLVTQTAMDGTSLTTHEQVWIDLTTDRFRVLSGPVDGEAQRFLTSDGSSIIDMDLTNGTSEVRPMPELGDVKQFVPTLQPGFAYPQPLWGQMGTPLSQLAFTSDFAQNEGTFKPVGTELIAGREALMVEWIYAGSELPSWRMWLDTEKAVILKMQSFDKGGGDVILSEAVVNQVSFDDVFANSLFGAPQSLPKFSDILGQPLTAGQPVPTASSEPDPLRDVYFIATDHVYGNETTHLMRAPGSCIAGLVACPNAETVPTPFDLKFSFPSLAWSPSGDVAALPYPINNDGNHAALFLFDPQAQTWTSLAEFNFIDPPLWSPDGQRLAFRVQDGAGRDEAFVINRDGSGLTNLSANENLPADGQPYTLHGWINTNVILRGRNEMIYIVRVDDGLVKPLFDTPWVKSQFIPSPDGYFLAHMDANDERAILQLLTPNGNTKRDLATFEKASLYPIVWSPDGSKLAFVKMTQDLAEGQDVYMVNSDGSNFQQVYHSGSASITEMTFSPDGQYLLVQDDDATGRHLFVVNFATMEKHLVQIPNLPLDWWLLAPSWQK